MMVFTVGGGNEDYVLCLLAKQLLIHKLPQVLILHVKRFSINSYEVMKNSTYMSFPLLLDVAPYCDASCLEVLLSVLL